MLLDADLFQVKFVRYHRDVALSSAVDVRLAIVILQLGSLPPYIDYLIKSASISAHLGIDHNTQTHRNGSIFVIDFNTCRMLRTVEDENNNLILK